MRERENENIWTTEQKNTELEKETSANLVP